MKVSDLIEKLGLSKAHEKFRDLEIATGYTSDLLSDVMGNAQEGCVLISIQAHKNTVAVATLVGASAILICNSRPLPADMVDAAEREGLALLQSPDNQFTVSGRIWTLLEMT